MAERDPEFVQDVLQIVYAALSDREALAAAMSGQPPMPVAADEPPPPGSPPSGSSPLSEGVSGGATYQVPPSIGVCCSRTMRVPYEDLWLGQQINDGDINVETDANAGIPRIQQETSATREEVMQELMRRALRAQIPGLLADVQPAAPAPPDPDS